MTTKTLHPYLWMLTGSFAFSWMVILANLAGQGCPWQVVALVRSLVPLVVVAGWAKLAGVRLVFRGPPILWVRSLAGSCSLVGTFFALTRLPPSDVVTIANIFPVWVAVLSWPLLGTLPSPGVWASAACGIAGVAIIQQPHLAEGNYVVLVVLAVSLFTAVALMGLHRLHGIDPRAVVVHFSATSLLFSVAAFSLGTAETEAPLHAYHALLLLGVGLSATVGQFCLTKAFTTGEAAKVSVVSLSQVVFVLILDLLVLDHRPEPIRLLGIPLILGPTAWLLLHRPPAPAPVKELEKAEPAMSER